MSDRDAGPLDPWAVAAAFAAVSVSEAVDLLLKAAEDAGADLASRPVIRLHLAGGGEVAGRLMGRGGGRDGALLLAAVVDCNEVQAAYVALDAVVAVTVESAQRHVARLSRGKLSPPDTREVPSALTLRRRVGEWSLARPSSGPLALSLDPPTPPEDAVGRLAVAGVLDVLTAALGQVAADDAGRDALAAVGRVTLRPADVALEVARDGDALRIRFDRPPTADALADAVAAVL